jgi:predicted kinase
MLTLIQMHGEPGSGKSTLARALGRSLGAVVMDKDLVHWALLRSDFRNPAAGAAAYAAHFATAESVLRQNYSVVLDNPVYYPAIEAQSRRIAEDCGALYILVECTCRDETERARRLGARVIQAPTDPGNPLPGFQPTGPRIVVDTQRPLDEVVGNVLGQLRRRAPL